MARISYPLNQSPFFRLSSKRKLAEILGFESHDFDALVDDSNYRQFFNKKDRSIEHPIGELASVHKRIAKLLSRVELPDYLHSQKGRSYISNAKAHVKKSPLIKSDISKFYPSTTFTSIYSLFNNDFHCSPDVSWQMARICCYKGKHLPTGSYLSGIVAYLTHREMFDEISKLAINHGCVMTCYVDDIVISGSNANKALLFQVRKIVSKNGLIAKPEKSKTFPAHSVKVVTGVAISGDKIEAPNKQLKEIRLTREKLKRARNSKLRANLMLSLQGRYLAVKQIVESD